MIRRFILGVLFLSACGDINGGKPFAGAAQYQPDDGAWSVRYLSPPWLLLHTEGESAAFAVAPSLLSADVAHATATLTIDPHHERAADAIATALAHWKAAHPSGTAPEAPSPLTNEAGQMGLEFAAVDAAAGEFHREAYFDGAHACFGLVFDGRVPLDTTDVTSLIAGFVTTP